MNLNESHIDMFCRVKDIYLLVLVFVLYIQGTHSIEVIGRCVVKQGHSSRTNEQLPVAGKT